MGGRLVSKLLQGKGSVVVLTMPGQANRRQGGCGGREPRQDVR